MKVILGLEMEKKTNNKKHKINHYAGTVFLNYNVSVQIIYIYISNIQMSQKKYTERHMQGDVWTMCLAYAHNTQKFNKNAHWLRPNTLESLKKINSYQVCTKENQKQWNVQTLFYRHVNCNKRSGNKGKQNIKIVTWSNYINRTCDTFQCSSHKYL